MNTKLTSTIGIELLTQVLFSTLWLIITITLLLAVVVVAAAATTAVAVVVVEFMFIAPVRRCRR